VATEDERARAAAAEQVEEVDVDGRVLRVVDRAEMRAGRLRHRCTYIAVLDAEGRLLVHQRAPWKDVWPSRWDIAFGGVVGVGEDWTRAAARELAEEAGVVATEGSLVELGTASYDDDAVSVLGRAYLAHHDGPFTFPDGEVVASDRIAMDDLEDWLATHETCPDSVAIVVPPLASGARRHRE
jgi:isopentenyldiphosphate isomerase